jgi:hypothetical protein
MSAIGPKRTSALFLIGPRSNSISELRTRTIRTVTIKFSPGANNARDFARHDCGRYIQHNDDLQNDRRQRGSLCQRRLSSRLRSARARGGRASRSRCLPLCYRKWRAGSALRITAKSNSLKQHNSAKRTSEKHGVRFSPIVVQRTCLPLRQSGWFPMPYFAVSPSSIPAHRLQR